jgi:hypothetical protein
MGADSMSASCDLGASLGLEHRVMLVDAPASSRGTVIAAPI